MVGLVEAKFQPVLKSLTRDENHGVRRHDGGGNGARTGGGCCRRVIVGEHKGHGTLGKEGQDDAIELRKLVDGHREALPSRNGLDGCGLSEEVEGAERIGKLSLLDLEKLQRTRGEEGRSRQADETRTDAQGQRAVNRIERLPSGLRGTIVRARERCKRIRRRGNRGIARYSEVRNLPAEKRRDRAECGGRERGARGEVGEACRDDCLIRLTCCTLTSHRVEKHLSIARDISRNRFGGTGRDSGSPRLPRRGRRWSSRASGIYTECLADDSVLAP